MGSKNIMKSKGSEKKGVRMRRDDGYDARCKDAVTRWDQGFRLVHDAVLNGTISEVNGTHEVMNFCASWYPVVAAAAAAVAVVDCSSSPLTSDSESSTTAREPNPIGRSP